MLHNHILKVSFSCIPNLLEKKVIIHHLIFNQKMMKSYIVYSDTCLSFGTLCSVMQVKLTEISNNATLFNMQVIQDSGYSGLCLRGTLYTI
jgi:hypothetical protein